MAPPPALGVDELVRAYLIAKRHVIEHGFDGEVAWQFDAAMEPVDEPSFLREAAWVVLSAGMSEATVSRVFPAIAEACGGFDPEWISEHRSAARSACLAVFGHDRKIDAVLEIAVTARSLGAHGLRQALADPELFLRSLPYVGPVTWRHLAKNLGAPVAKPDRHMMRFAQAAGWQSVDDLCEGISSWLGDPVPVVDVVLWRWSVLHAQHCAIDCGGLPHEGGQRASRGTSRRPAVSTQVPTSVTQRAQSAVPAS